MATLEDTTELIRAAACNTCIPIGMEPYVILAALILKGNGMPVPTDTNELLYEARCLTCIPIGLLPYVTINVIRTMTPGGGVQYGTVVPTAAPPGGSGTYYRTDTGDFWVWNPVTATWDALID